jgi:hypothetical protein
MKFLIALIAALLLNATAWAEDFQRYSPSGVGPVTIKSEIVKLGKSVRIHATATNNSGVPIRYARFCVRGLRAKANDCAGVLGWREVWPPEAVVSWDESLPRPVNPGAYDIGAALLIPADKIDLVQEIRVGLLDGNDKDMARDQLMALIVNSRRFKLAGGSMSADATLTGRAETWEAGSVSDLSARTATSGGVLASRVAAIGGSVANGTSRDSTKKIIDKAMVIRLTLSTGESIWAWDDSKDCPVQSKAKCAIDALLEFAAHPPIR